jgi:uncharacterized protein with LGFP repeats
MRATTKRTAVFSAAIAGFALIGAGCTHATKSGETTTPATTSVTSSATPGAAAPTGPSAAPSTTQMTGANGTAYTVSGPILDKYNSLDEKARKDLGAPTHDQVTNPDGGIWQTFDGGVIIYKTAAHVVWGKIRDAWITLGGSQGQLGYPTSDEETAPDGVKKSTFEHGTITWKPGDAEAKVTPSP